MTAEIGLLNKYGIALAADSAVTIGRGKGYYNTANKLFALSKYEPVAVMVYNQASIMGYPLEILIKEYRKKLGKTKFDYLNQYWEDFILYLKEFLTDSERKIDYKKYYYNEVFNVFKSIHNKIQEKIDTIPDEVDSKSGELQDMIIDLIEKEIIRINGIFNSFEIDEKLNEKKEQIITECKDSIINIMNRVFGNSLHEEMINKLLEIAVMILTKKLKTGGYTGIVIAGYGEKDMYPRLICGQFRGAYFNELKYNINDSVEISDTNLASIMPFAQKDVVETFLNGYDINLIVDLLETINENDEDGKMVDKVISTVKQKSNEYHTKVINRTVSVAPKEELAHMAETLVNLTSFRRKLALDDFSQTVGGPIDVALITKGDGLVWIKRKLYFDKELNYNFFNNYYKEREYDKFICNQE